MLESTNFSRGWIQWKGDGVGCLLFEYLLCKYYKCEFSGIHGPLSRCILSVGIPKDSRPNGILRFLPSVPINVGIGLRFIIDLERWLSEDCAPVIYSTNSRTRTCHLQHPSSLGKWLSQALLVLVVNSLKSRNTHFRDIVIQLTFTWGEHGHDFMFCAVTILYFYLLLFCERECDFGSNVHLRCYIS